MDYLGAGEAAADSVSGGYWQLAMILAAIGLLGLYSRWRRARTPPPVTLAQLRKIDEDPDRYRAPADKAIVELLETSRSLNAQVDTKIRVLNRLVKEAEEQAGRLEKLLAESRGAAPAPVGGSAASGAEPPGGRIGVRPEAGAGRSRLTELQERIRRLHSEGRSLAEIARATALSTTEVGFALDNLRDLSEAAND
ncbi:MAG: hypothetical protein LBV15_05745 [Planctomycetota bacterium]|jgi:hypothetical protein|nr:hypothetical protein [Planctomycetota bacterium]